MGFKIEDIIDEIFDMIKPKTPQVITQKEFLNCGCSDIIVTMLIDAKGFYDYDQREQNNKDDDEEEEEDFFWNFFTFILINYHDHGQFNFLILKWKINYF